MPDAIVDSLIVRSLGWALVQFVWQGAAVALITAVTLRLLDRRTAAARYLVASAGLLAMFVLPVATTIEHARRLSAEPVSTTVSTASPATSSISTPSPVTGRQLSVPTPPLATEGPPVVTAPAGRSSETWLPAAVLVWCAGVIALSMRLHRACDTYVSRHRLEGDPIHEFFRIADGQVVRFRSVFAEIV